MTTGVEGSILKKHMPTLDGLRGSACIWVVFAHFDRAHLPMLIDLKTAHLTVVLFFILSGFLMGYLYLDKPFTARNAADYMTARIARVVPLFWLVMIGCYVMSVLAGPGFVHFIDFKEFMRLMTFTGSAYSFWSVAPEMQFYVIFLGLWWVWTRTSETRTIAIVATIAAAITLMWIGPVFPGTFVFSKMHLFLIGIVLSRLALQLPDSEALGRSAIIQTLQTAAFGFLMLLAISPAFSTAAFSFIEPHYQPEFAETWIPVYADMRWSLLMGAFLLLFTIDTPLCRMLLGNRFFVLAGQYSFSIYLLHTLVLADVQKLLIGTGMSAPFVMIIGLVAIAGVSAASYQIIERGGQRLVRRHLTPVGHRIADMADTVWARISNRGTGDLKPSA